MGKFRAHLGTGDNALPGIYLRYDEGPDHSGFRTPSGEELRLLPRFLGTPARSIFPRWLILPSILEPDG
jgi:hypothetical protein